MLSAVRADSQTPARQLALPWDPTITERFRCVRDVVAQGVYRRGLKRCAADMDMAPGNLSVALGDDGIRHLSVDALEKYIQASGDVEPVLYLAVRYCARLLDADEAAKTARMEALMAEMRELIGEQKARRR